MVKEIINKERFYLCWLDLKLKNKKRKTTIIFLIVFSYSCFLKPDFEASKKIKWRGIIIEKTRIAVRKKIKYFFQCR